VDLELTGKTALVTGASKGIGKAIARTLAREGVRVAVCSRDSATLATAAKEIGAGAKGEVIPIAGDLSRLEDVQRVVEDSAGRLGRLDILINNAGAIRGGDFLKIPDEQWSGDWSLKLLGYVRMARAVFPQMQTQGGGRICNVVGAASRNPSSTYLPGGIANAGLINFTKGLADLGAPSRILVTAVSPAATATERWDSLMEQQAAAAGKSVEAFRADAQKGYPLGRIATPDDIADLVCFLVSARASFITGICITVDGGATRGVYL
jgi:NAD(P)-dependent dehydrogenase (short-subunit alcohol dehydrogenase family)